MKKYYTSQDAYARISKARVGSLVNSRLTNEYLQELRDELVAWLDQVDRRMLNNQAQPPY
jgi:hypothetical protein